MVNNPNYSKDKTPLIDCLMQIYAIPKLMGVTNIFCPEPLRRQGHRLLTKQKENLELQSLGKLLGFDERGYVSNEYFKKTNVNPQKDGRPFHLWIPNQDFMFDVSTGNTPSTKLRDSLVNCIETEGNDFVFDLRTVAINDTSELEIQCSSIPYTKYVHRIFKGDSISHSPGLNTKAGLAVYEHDGLIPNILYQLIQNSNLPWLLPIETEKLLADLRPKLKKHSMVFRTPVLKTQKDYSSIDLNVLSPHYKEVKTTDAEIFFRHGDLQARDFHGVGWFPKGLELQIYGGNITLGEDPKHPDKFSYRKYTELKKNIKNNIPKIKHVGYEGNKTLWKNKFTPKDFLEIMRLIRGNIGEPQITMSYGYVPVTSLPKNVDFKVTDTVLL